MSTGYVHWRRVAFIGGRPDKGNTLRVNANHGADLGKVCRH